MNNRYYLLCGLRKDCDFVVRICGDFVALQASANTTLSFVPIPTKRWIELRSSP